MTECELIPDRGKITVSVYRDSTPVYADRVDPKTVRGRKKAAEACRVDDETFLRWCEETRRADRPTRFNCPEPETAKANTPVFLVRPKDQQDSSATRHEVTAEVFLKEILPTLGKGILGKWNDADALCCLDIDYHDKKPPRPEWLENVVYTRTTPKPYAWHLSKGGGLHLFYLPAPPYTAKELAAVAALRYRVIDPSAGLELKTAVFGPGDREYTIATYQDTAASVLPWLGSPEYDDTEREEWLEERGMSLDARYTHEHCPMAPHETSHGEPVCVNAAGIYCFKCEALGNSLGTRKPGMATWAALLGAPSSGDMGALVRNLVHWGHARWVLTEKYGLPLSFARLAYSAALKAAHAGTDRENFIPQVFSESTDTLARVGTRWMNLETAFSYPKDILPILSRLPHAMILDEKGKVRTDSAVVCLLSQMDDLSRRGYSGINVIHGFKMTGPFLVKPTDPATVAIVDPKLTKAGEGRCGPKYVPLSRRMPEDEAWGYIEEVAPGIDRALVKAAIAGFACAQETRAGMQPIVFVSGPSGAAKTTTLKLAAGMYGSRSHDVVFEPEPARLRQSVQQGAGSCAAILFNEILKDSARGRHKMSPREALDPILNFTEDSASWVAYVGPVKMGRLPALFLTEPVCPTSLREETQLARRIRHHRVEGRKDAWKSTITAAGLGADVHLLRTVSDSVNRACDAILSYVCDEFFRSPLTWDVIADTLGVRTIEESSDFDDNSQYLREFFRLVCLAPELEGSQAKMYAGSYKRISREAAEKDSPADHLQTVWTMFADGGGSDWLASRKLTEKDWSAVLKSALPVQLDVKTDGVSVYVRFRSGPVKDPGTKYNGAIVDPSQWESLL